MLFGWLFMGGSMVNGTAFSCKRKKDAIRNKKRTYVDACGHTRYVDSDLPIDASYEILKNDNRYDEEVVFWRKKIDERKQELEKAKQTHNTWDIDICEKQIETAQKKLKEAEVKRDKLKQSFSKFDELEKQRLTKQGYKF